MERRRSWAAAGRLPPQIASRFTLAEQAVLAVEVAGEGECVLTLEHIAALAGACRKTVKGVRFAVAGEGATYEIRNPSSKLTFWDSNLTGS